MTLRAPNPPLAIALILTATAFIAGTMILAKLLGTGVLGAPLHPLQVSHGRFLFAFLTLCALAAVLRPHIRQPDLRLHIGRTAFGWGGVTLMFAAVAFMPLSDATAISFLNPVFGRWVAAATSLIGALVLLRPGPETFQIAGLLALGAAVLMGIELIFIKKLANREPPFQILLVNNAIGLCIATLAVLPVWTMPTAGQWAALAGIGVLMASAQTCFVNAMARADASFVTPFSYLTLVFAAVYDGVIFGVVPDRISVLGAVIILSGATLLALRERKNKNSP